MYSVHDEVKIKGKMEELIIHSGFPMGSSRKTFKIQGCDIKDINVMGSAFAIPMATDLVHKKYLKLIDLLTDLLTDDDDSGESVRQALNHIEKFRLEIKNKYRDFLKKKELEMMSAQLMVLQKEAMERYLMIREK